MSSTLAKCGCAAEVMVHVKFAFRFAGVESIRHAALDNCQPYANMHLCIARVTSESAILSGSVALALMMPLVARRPLIAHGGTHLRTHKWTHLAKE